MSTIEFVACAVAIAVTFTLIVITLTACWKSIARIRARRAERRWFEIRDPDYASHIFGPGSGRKTDRKFLYNRHKDGSVNQAFRINGRPNERQQNDTE